MLRHHFQVNIGVTIELVNARKHRSEKSNSSGLEGEVTREVWKTGRTPRGGCWVNMHDFISVFSFRGTFTPLCEFGVKGQSYVQTIGSA